MFTSVVSPPPPPSIPPPPLCLLLILLRCFPVGVTQRAPPHRRYSLRSDSKITPPNCSIRPSCLPPPPPPPTIDNTLLCWRPTLYSLSVCRFFLLAYCLPFQYLAILSREWLKEWRRIPEPVAVWVRPSCSSVPTGEARGRWGNRIRHLLAREWTAA